MFHPNIKDYFCIQDYWAAGQSLVDTIAKISDMIQFRVYNPASPLDALAARWASQNTNLFPLGNVSLGTPEVMITLGSKRDRAKQARRGAAAPAAVGAADARGVGARAGGRRGRPADQPARIGLIDVSEPERRKLVLTEEDMADRRRRRAAPAPPARRPARAAARVRIAGATAAASAARAGVPDGQRRRRPAAGRRRHGSRRRRAGGGDASRHG